MTYSGAPRFRALLNGSGPIVIAGAHHGLSAKLAVEAGFDGIWASGFEFSAARGVPDANILTMAENVEEARRMGHVMDAPIVADCDNGYGNAINVIHMIRQYEAAGVAAICIEDNIFPKRCSFYVGVERELASIDEHCGKIRAAKDAQRSPDFAVIARTEALIAGWGMEEALKRGNAYAEAGADMVLIHSKAKEPDEILHFASQWKSKTPLVCVPTTYSNATVAQLYEAGYKLIIFANHGLRSSLKAMRTAYQTLREQGKTASVTDQVVSLAQVYDVVGVAEMREDEGKYMPAGATRTTGIVLSAGAEKSIGPVTEDRPSAMLDIRGKSLLERKVDVFNECSIKDVVVVRGYKKEQIQLPSIRTYDNDAYASTGEAASLFSAASELDRRVVVSYGDTLFERSVLEKLLRASGDITIVVDRSIAERPVEERKERTRDFVIEEAPALQDSDRFVGSDGTRKVKAISTSLPAGDANGEFVGLAMLSPEGCQKLKEIWEAAQGAKGSFHDAASVQMASLTDLLQEAIDAGVDVRAVDVYKGWMDIDSFEDYQRAWNFHA